MDKPFGGARHVDITVQRKDIMDYAIIEQTKDYEKRIVYDPATNAFFESEYDCIFRQRGFAYPYGWLKGSGTPPEEHLDIFLLCHDACALGDELPVKVVGVFKRNDGDHKLVGICPEREETDFSELPAHEKNDLLKLYPRIDAGEGWFGRDVARDVIEDFMRNGRIQEY